jgi:hypothetical protein
MGMIETAQADIKRIRTDPNGFTKSIFFRAPTSETATIFGMHAAIHMGTDTDGQVVNAKKAHVSISESALTDLGYPTRNAAQEVDLKDHRVSVTDSTGITKEYIISETFPDEAVGLIVCFLKDFE